MKTDRNQQTSMSVFLNHTCGCLLNYQCYVRTCYVYIKTQKCCKENTYVHMYTCSYVAIVRELWHTKQHIATIIMFKVNLGFTCIYICILQHLSYYKTVKNSEAEIVSYCEA